ncbi:MAG: carbamoyltransferase [Candidatus Liptonbacteria bacterium]|nr:carbamoyltransferase [Candidatus Liptonbacteria bacterium]
MTILGISAFYHDSAAAIVRDGEIVAAAQEERFSRKKHDERFPKHAVAYCLKEAGITINDVDYVAFYEKPFLKFERLLQSYFSTAPRGFASFIKAMPLWVKDKLWMKAFIAKELDFGGKMLFPEHHESHAASAFYPSPFESAAILTMDGVGEWATTTFGRGRGNKFELLGEINFPHSLGLLYSAFTYYAGFKVNSGEYKLMGLAPYGEPKYRDLIERELVDIKEDGSFAMNMNYFDYVGGLRMTNKKFHDLFGGPPRKQEDKLTQKDMDIARSIQDVTEEIVLRMARHVRRVTGEKYLCLAGGVALNCVANGKLLREKIFDGIWIQPAAGDAGGALGSALAIWYQYLNNKRMTYVDKKTGKQSDMMRGAYLGPEFSNEEIKKFLDRGKITYRYIQKDDELFSDVARALADEKVVGWLSGRMEFGPRALGARSILGDARSEKMQSVMNLKIKFRESFRPFAPSVLMSRVSEYFELKNPSPYMLLVADVVKSKRLPAKKASAFGLERLLEKRSVIPAVTHVDYSARVQTVHEDTNPRYHKLIDTFAKKTGCPVIVNTSFNVRGEPIVCTPENAYRCFMRTDMDYLVLGNYILDKKDQPKMLHDTDWKKEFELD